MFVSPASVDTAGDRKRGGTVALSRSASARSMRAQSPTTEHGRPMAAASPTVVDRHFRFDVAEPLGNNSNQATACRDTSDGNQVHGSIPGASAAGRGNAVVAAEQDDSAAMGSGLQRGSASAASSIRGDAIQGSASEAPTGSSSPPAVGFVNAERSPSAQPSQHTPPAHQHAPAATDDLRTASSTPGPVVAGGSARSLVNGNSDGDVATASAEAKPTPATS